MSQLLVFFLSACCATYLAEALRKPKNSIKPDSCKCLGWHDAFSPHYSANCSGNHDGYVCDRFLMKLPNENFCMNYFFGNTTQWCYVDSHCQSGLSLIWAEDGAKTNLLWKKCDEDYPSLLKNKKFDDFITWAKKNDLDLGVAAQYAYPQFSSASLFDVMSFWDLKLPSDAPSDFIVTPKANMSRQLKSKLQEQVDSGETMFFTSDSGYSPFGVVEGDKFYWLNVGKTFLNLLEAGKENMVNAGEVTEAKCVHGCSNNVQPWLSPLNNIKH